MKPKAKTATDNVTPIKPAVTESHLVITPPNFEVAVFRLVGTAPYSHCALPGKVLDKIRATQAEGQTARNKKPRAPKDFDALYRSACHISTDGWYGIPASAFRKGMIDACRTAGFKMTEAKMSIFALADGIDANDGLPLIRIDGEPEMWVTRGRNANGGIDVRARPRWMQWSAVVRVRYDADQFRQIDVANLLARMGISIGIGEGRPFSRDSAGIGYGTFELASE